MTTSTELRETVAKSDFFGKVASAEFGSNLTGSGSTIYGIHHAQDMVLSLGSGGKVKALFPTPLHHVDHIELDPASGALAMWSSRGLSIAQAPLMSSTKAHQVELDLGARSIERFRWGVRGLYHVLLSSGELLTFDLGGGEQRASETAPDATLVDFVVGEGDSFFLVDTNGNVYENGDLLANSQITGDNLRIQMIAPNVLVIASGELAAHMLLLDDEVYTVEKIELDLFDEIELVNDPTCATRYFIHSAHAVLCVSVGWVEEVAAGDSVNSQSSVETLLTSPGGVVGGVHLAAGRIPNSITQDGPVLVASLSTGAPGTLIPLLTLPTAMMHSKTQSTSRKNAPTPKVTNKLAELLEHKPERLSLAGLDRNMSPAEQMEHVLRITGHLRSAHFARGIAVREAIEEEAATIKRTRQRQQEQLNQLAQLEQRVRNNAETLGEKFENIQEKQIELELRVAKLTRQQESAPLSKAEREAGRELRITDRELTHFAKSIKRAKQLATDYTQSQQKTLAQDKSFTSIKNVMRPLADFSGRLESIVASLKKIQIE